jgi:hypothetical protein
MSAVRAEIRPWQENYLFFQPLRRGTLLPREIVEWLAEEPGGVYTSLGLISRP